MCHRGVLQERETTDQGDQQSVRQDRQQVHSLTKGEGQIALALAFYKFQKLKKGVECHVS